MDGSILMTVSKRQVLLALAGLVLILFALNDAVARSAGKLCRGS